MMESFGIDEFGREHFVVEAARGRLGISLGEDEHGFVVVRCLDVLTPKELEGWEPSDRHRVEMLREVLQEGDRLVEIQGDDIVHCSLAEVISRLSKLSAIKRHLTFARYHSTGFDTKKYDVEKLVLARLPRGPLGLQINEYIPYGAFIEDFQLLPDGSMSRLAKHPKIHRGCQIINVNGLDVTSMSREEVIAHLSTLRDQDKEVVFYRTARRTCSSIYKVESSASERHLGFTLDENESVRCVVTSVGPRGHSSISPGDVLIGVNSTDISWMRRKESIEFVKDTPLPRQLIFVRLGEQAIPECHQISLASGPLGVNLDGQEPHHAKITGFTTPADADQPAFKSCSTFLPGSFIVSIGKLDVSTHDLASISGMLVKLKNHPKQIVVANAPLLRILAGEAPIQRVKVPKGPLGIHFDSSRTGAAVISGYFKLQDDQVGEVEKTSRVPVGSTLLRMNGLNVSCLTLDETLGVLKKLSDKPKELEFYFDDSAQDINTKTVDIRVPPGPLGIDLKCSISNKVIVDKLNSDPSRGPTRIAQHGGVIEGSEIVAIDGFDVSTHELLDVLQLLRTLAEHEKVITFSTTRSAYEGMKSTSKNPHLISLAQSIVWNASDFDSRYPNQAIILKDVAKQSLESSQEIRGGSRLVAIDGIDIRSMKLAQIVEILENMSGAPCTVVFDTGSSSPSPPPSPRHGEKYTLERKPSSSAVISPTMIQSNSTASSPAKDTIIRSSSIAGILGDGPPPTPAASLAPLLIRTLEATRLGAASADVTKIEEAANEEKRDSVTKPIEYMINMSSWTGSRSLYRLLVDPTTRSLQITSAKPSTPKPGKQSASISVAFSEIVSLDCGKGARFSSQSSPSSSRSLFRSASSTLNTDATDRANVCISLSSSKKSIEFDMRSIDERAAFAQHLHAFLPALVPQS